MVALLELIADECARSLWEPVQPDIYVERTTSTFKTAPESVKKLGPLSKSWEIEGSYRFEIGFAGVNGFEDLRKHPHYQLYGKRKEMAKAVRNKGVELTVSRINTGVADVFDNGFAFSVTNFDETYKNVVHKYMPRLDFLSVAEDLDGHDVCDRGNMAFTRGITDQNIKSVTVDDVKTLPQPKPFGDNRRVDVERMCLVTSIVYDVCDSLGLAYPAIVNDQKRLDMFALQLCREHKLPVRDSQGRPANIFEMATFAMTDCPMKRMTKEELAKIILFGCHVDSKNCPTYTRVYVVYCHVFLRGKWKRVSMICTWRKSVMDYLRRLDGAKFFTEQQIVPYFQHFSDRHQRSLDDCHPEEYKNRLYEPFPLRCSFDKLSGESVLSTYLCLFSLLFVP